MTDHGQAPDFDLTDDELRATGSAKWTYQPAGVVAAWVAELDVRPAPAVAGALHRAVDAGTLGYPGPDSRLGEALAEFAQKRWDWVVDPAAVIASGDVMAGVILTLQAVCEPGPVVVPVPSYPPFLAAPPLTGRPVASVPCLDLAATPRLDLDGIDAALAAGARTVLLANPHNPLGRCFTAAELAGLRDVALRHGARVISDEIHAPLVLPGARHVPYATLDGTADHVTTVLAASKAWNLPGLKCAQVIPGNAADARRFADLPMIANHGLSPLGVVASVAAYTEGVAWLDGLLEHLADRRSQFADLLAAHLPQVTWRPMEGTYLAWVDASATGAADPAAAALQRGHVMVNGGHAFTVPGDRRYDRCVRVNLGTSAERLERVVRGLAAAWTPDATPDPAS